MTDEEALAAFPGAQGFMEVTNASRPLGAFGVVVDKDGTAWAFDGDSPRPITPEELKSLGALTCKPSDAVELIPTELLPGSKQLSAVITKNSDASCANKIVVCRICGQKNRIADRPGVARCGKCKAPLRRVSIFGRILRVISYVWLSLLAAVVALSGLGILLTDGIWKFWEIFSPFNIWNWGLIFILALPAIGLVKVAKRLDHKVSSAPQEDVTQESESSLKVKPAKKSVGEGMAEVLRNLKPGECQEHCQQSDAAEDAALGHSILEEPPLNEKPRPLVLQPTVNLDRALSEQEQYQRALVLEQILKIDEEKKYLEDQIEQQRLLRKHLVERLGQIPKRN